MQGQPELYSDTLSQTPNKYVDKSNPSAYASLVVGTEETEASCNIASFCAGARCKSGEADFGCQVLTPAVQRSRDVTQKSCEGRGLPDFLPMIVPLQLGWTRTAVDISRVLRGKGAALREPVCVGGMC